MQRYIISVSGCHEKINIALHPVLDLTTDCMVIPVSLFWFDSVVYKLPPISQDAGPFLSSSLSILPALPLSPSLSCLTWSSSHPLLDHMIQSSHDPVSNNLTMLIIFCMPPRIPASSTDIALDILLSNYKRWRIMSATK